MMVLVVNNDGMMMGVDEWVNGDGGQELLSFQ